MQVRILGAHNLDSKHGHHTCILVDEVLAVDAGSLASTLALDEQFRVRDVLLTHLHFDHARDLPTLGLVTLEAPPITVHAEAPTYASVQAHLLDGEAYPNLFEPLNDGPPSLAHRPVELSVPFTVGAYRVQAVRAHHPVPTVGYVIEADGRRVGITGDTGGGIAAFSRLDAPPEVLLVDVSFPDRMRWRADRSLHLTPAMLEEEIRGMQAEGLRIPRLVPVHRSLAEEAEILTELAGVARRTGVDIEPGMEDMLV
jgi:ribonuclease BN (tRNA processing enzyme)